MLFKMTEVYLKPYWSEYQQTIKEIEKIDQWCVKNCSKAFYRMGSSWFFENSQDAVLFKLRWG